jgi:uncharacterized damage-inducible protein DinB
VASRRSVSDDGPMVTTAFPEPASTPDLRGLMLDYLDFYRDVVAEKVDGLSADQLVDSVVPSGWTPAGLVNHLVNVERRWLRWGFLAERVPDPWRDATADGGWVTPDTSPAELRRALEAAGVRSRSIVEAHELTETAAVGGRFADEASAPQLQWILLHLIQEYARHSGHHDNARELVDGRTGETG